MFVAWILLIEYHLWLNNHVCQQFQKSYSIFQALKYVTGMNLYSIYDILYLFIAFTGDVKLIPYWSLTAELSVLLEIALVHFDAIIILSTFRHRIFNFCGAGLHRPGLQSQKEGICWHCVQLQTVRFPYTVFQKLLHRVEYCDISGFIFHQMQTIFSLYTDRSWA